MPPNQKKLRVMNFGTTVHSILSKLDVICPMNSHTRSPERKFTLNANIHFHLLKNAFILDDQQIARNMIFYLFYSKITYYDIISVLKTSSTQKDNKLI